MNINELRNWLGPALEELTSEQVDRLTRESHTISTRYPDPDEQDLRDAALSAAVQYLRGETSIDDAGSTYTAARLATNRLQAASRQIAAMASTDGMPDLQAARRSGVDRMTLLKDLGKR